MSGVVLVLGATGNTGAEVVDRLTALPGVAVRTATRATTAPTAAEHVRFDWSDSSTHRSALDGVERIYLVAPVGDPDPIRAVGPFLAQAVAMGVRRVVMLSSSAVALGDPGLGLVASAVRNTLPEWVILRPSWFMQNFVESHPLADSIRATGEFITATGRGRLPFIDAADIGRCGAALLASPHAGNAEHRLTGPQAMSYDEAAAVMTAITGRPVRHRAVDTEHYVDFLIEAGYEVGFASALAALDNRIRDGEEAQVTDAVERLTGEPPRSFAEYLRENARIRT
jgi:uncharacterized protein YbjT (DUF2867 family)